MFSPLGYPRPFALGGHSRRAVPLGHREADAAGERQTLPPCFGVKRSAGLRLPRAKAWIDGKRLSNRIYARSFSGDELEYG